MGLYIYTAEALNPTMTKHYDNYNGMISEYIVARSQMEALHMAMNSIIATIHSCEDFDPAELSISSNETIGTITIVESMTQKIINHIQNIVVHDCL